VMDIAPPSDRRLQPDPRPILTRWGDRPVTSTPHIERLSECARSGSARRIVRAIVGDGVERGADATDPTGGGGGERPLEDRWVLAQ